MHITMRRLLRQTSVKHYFLAANFSKSKIYYCEECRRKFESKYHLKYHLSITAPCRNPYIERSKDKPHTLLQNMSDEILYLISDFLLLKDLVNFIRALPRLLICHGMKTLWLRRMDYQHPRFVPNKMTDVKICWLMRNNLALLNIDHFINNRSQGDNSHVDEDWRKYRRLFVKNPRGASTFTSCNRHERIWNFQQYLNKRQGRAIRNQRGPTGKWLLF